ncbi:glycerol-3-phosphate dehydrogenase [Gammaproteobacteria bacterium LSUCC0112]|nr:glycerol-3-phosphate dehydrogenase [Gammaproteobacteria bacterium LSUCC0112]
MSATLSMVDLLVIGGGVNGTGIAADAAGRGLSVMLCERADLGGATSSSSTKLIHGGLRYLETYQFRLVRESLAEREVLLHAAPHIVWPLRFRLPHHKALRPQWMIRSGLFLYDHLSKRVSLPASHGVKFDDNDPLTPEFRSGFEYSDCWVDDARLVVLNAMQAKQLGASILTRTVCEQIDAQVDPQTKNTYWTARLKNTQTGEEHWVNAHCIVNASGPWVGKLGRQLQPRTPPSDVRLVKGSHIVVPRMYEGEEAYLLQNPDGRVVFVIPYEDEFSLIGTTEEEYQGDPSAAVISPAEIAYLLDVAGNYFKKVPDASQILHHFSGVRPLIDDGDENASKVSRDYTLDLIQSPAPLLTVYGGKITTYRRLAESAMEQLKAIFPTMKPAWTISAHLPGGDFESQETLLTMLAIEFPWVDRTLLRSWIRRYGTRSRILLNGAKHIEDLGVCFGPGMYEREIRYLFDHEWAQTADDVLWRRTKLGLRLNAQQQSDVAQFCQRGLTR